MTLVPYFLILLIGCFLVWFGGRHLLRYRGMQNWQEVPIAISDARVADRLDVIKYARLTYFFPEIRYEYEFEGKKYQSDSVALDFKGIWTESRIDAEKLLAKIITMRIGYCDPDRPEVSVILRAVSQRRISHYWALVVSGVFVIALAVALMVIA